MNRKVLCLIIVMALLSGHSLIAQDEKEIPKVDKTTPTITLPPSPGEVLNALSKIGRVQWSSLVTYNKFYNYKGRNKQALNIGIRVADAFVALHDKDKSNFGDMNTVIFGLAEELSISNIIEDQKNVLQELSQKDDWVLLVIELNTMNAELQEELIKQKEEDIVILSNVGAFFEGMRIVSSHFSGNYDAEKIGLLKQVELIDYYIGEIDKNKKLKKDETVNVAYVGLVDMRSYLNEDPDVTIETVEKIKAVANEVVKSISN